MCFTKFCALPNAWNRWRKRRPEPHTIGHIAFWISLFISFLFIWEYRIFKETMINCQDKNVFFTLIKNNNKSHWFTIFINNTEMLSAFSNKNSGWLNQCFGNRIWAVEIKYFSREDMRNPLWRITINK